MAKGTSLEGTEDAREAGMAGRGSWEGCASGGSQGQEQFTHTGAQRQWRVPACSSYDT